MDVLPTEIIIEILTICAYVHPKPSFIACVHSSWARIVLPILHAHLYFTHLRQLVLFSSSPPSKPSSTSSSNKIQPVSLSLTRTVSTTDTGVFYRIYEVLEKLETSRLDRVHFCLNSHHCGAGIVLLVLRQINPLHFKWTSPDPEHHFSIAIVAPAARSFSFALAEWERLVSLTLTNISFEDFHPSPLTTCSFASSFSPETHPNLRTVHIGQAVFMSPFTPVHILINLRSSLDSITLVDAYWTSIWGKRIRMNDICTAFKATILQSASGCEALKWEDFETRVNCGVERERIIGGDRG